MRDKGRGRASRSRAIAAFAGLLTLPLLSVLVACSSTPATANTPVADASSSSEPVIQTSPASTGTDCTTITQTYSVCADLSLCPGVTIDPSKFTNCGYSVHGTAIDPECLCYGSMCPMGAPSTCAEMAALLTTANALSVCDEYAAGHCENLGGTGAPSACDECKTNCDGILSCLRACGC
jgi:hypothetical protein